MIHLLQQFLFTICTFRRRKKKLPQYFKQSLLLLLIGIVAVSGCQTLRSRVEAGKVTHLSLWHGVNPPPNRDVLQKLVDKFNQTHVAIHVEWWR